VYLKFYALVLIFTFLNWLIGAASARWLSLSLSYLKGGGEGGGGGERGDAS
jgi:hypothetical protein